MSERHTLTPEFIGILSVGIGLAGLMTAIWSDLRTDVKTLREDIIILREDNREDNSRVETELRDNMQEGDDDLLEALGVVRSDLNGIDENQRAAETRLTVIETNLGFIRDELQSDSDPAADSPQ